MLPDRGQPVDLTLDGGWKVTARVVATGPRHVDLGAVDGPLRLPGGLEFCAVIVTWRTRLGAAEHHGVLTQRDDGTVRLQPRGEALQVQRRSFVRVPAELSTAVIAQEGRVLARTVDVSLGGMLFTPAQTLALEERVRFALDLGSLTISGHGTVVRGRSDGTRAVAFDELVGAADRVLSRYVARRQRELIATDRPDRHR